MARAITAKDLVQVRDERIVGVPPRPLTFEEFVASFGEDEEVELIDGTVVTRMAAPSTHENLFGWLYTVLRGYVTAKGLGIVLGSRTAVRIGEHRARLPDLLFVRAERAEIVREEGVYGAPDLVIEIFSPGDRPADRVALEADYRSLGVPEIWLVDQQNRHIRVVRRSAQGYRAQVRKRGLLRSEQVEGFVLQIAWLFVQPLPLEIGVLSDLLGAGT